MLNVLGIFSRKRFYGSWIFWNLRKKLSGATAVLFLEISEISIFRPITQTWNCVEHSTNNFLKNIFSFSIFFKGKHKEKRHDKKTKIFQKNFKNCWTFFNSPKSKKHNTKFLNKEKHLKIRGNDLNFRDNNVLYITKYFLIFSLPKIKFHFIHHLISFWLIQEEYDDSRSI